MLASGLRRLVESDWFQNLIGFLMRLAKAAIDGDLVALLSITAIVASIAAVLWLVWKRRSANRLTA